jgi:hypothetical protein
VRVCACASRVRARASRVRARVLLLRRGRRLGRGRRRAALGGRATGLASRAAEAMGRTVTFRAESAARPPQSRCARTWTRSTRPTPVRCGRWLSASCCAGRSHRWRAGCGSSTRRSMSERAGPSWVVPQLATLASQGWLSWLLAGLRARNEAPSRSGPSGRLRCGLHVRPDRSPTGDCTRSHLSALGTQVPGLHDDNHRRARRRSRASWARPTLSGWSRGSRARATTRQRARAAAYPAARRADGRRSLLPTPRRWLPGRAVRGGKPGRPVDTVGDRGQPRHARWLERARVRRGS